MCALFLCHLLARAGNVLSVVIQTHQMLCAARVSKRPRQHLILLHSIGINDLAGGRLYVKVLKGT